MLTNKNKLKGLIPVMVTPMLEGGSPDPEGIRSLTEFLINKGVGGLWVLGSASEDINMTLEERILVVRTTANAYSMVTLTKLSKVIFKSFNLWSTGKRCII